MLMLSSAGRKQLQRLKRGILCCIEDENIIQDVEAAICGCKRNRQ
jgi:hypothetical protein